MSQPKFILTSKGELRLGMVNRHYELLKADEHCYGGGYYEFDYLSNRSLIFSYFRFFLRYFYIFIKQGLFSLFALYSLSAFAN